MGDVVWNFTFSFMCQFLPHVNSSCVPGQGQPCMPQVTRNQTCMPVGSPYGRKFLRAVVGPPSNIDWSRPWHEILPDWHGKVQSVTLEHGMKLWSHRSLASYWKLATHFASVPHDRWIQRILRWMPDGRHTAGCPRHNWATKLSAFLRFLQMDEWQILAQDTALWLHLTEDFVHFCRH